MLDVILCFFLNFLLATEIIPNAISDRHAMVFSAFDYKKSYCTPTKRPIRCLSKEKITAIALTLKNILSNFTFSGNDVNEQWRLIKDIIISCIDSTAPLKKVPLKASNNLLDR